MYIHIHICMYIHTYKSRGEHSWGLQAKDRRCGADIYIHMYIVYIFIFEYVHTNVHIYVYTYIHTVPEASTAVGYKQKIRDAAPIYTYICMYINIC